MSTPAASEKGPKTNIIKKLSEFGAGFSHHHEKYEAVGISEIRRSGGVLSVDGLTFRFPEHFGFCYGVDKAIDMVFETCERFAGRRIFLTDQLIHNPFINGKLREKGVRYLQRDARHLLVTDELRSGDIVVVSAFGTDFRDIESLGARGVTIVDSTCGAIINVWKRVEGYARHGYITIMHGKRNHEETRATVSQAVKEGGSYITIENVAEARELATVVLGELSEADFLRRYPGAAPEGFRFEAATCKMGMANQTTMLKGESLEIQGILRQAFVTRFGEAVTAERFRSFDTICGATQDRQDALRQLLRHPLDLLLIVGGFNSSNTTHLAEIAQGHVPLHHIESADDLRSPDEVRSRDPRTGAVAVRDRAYDPSWTRIGLTAGASTPDVTLVDVIEKIRSFRKNT